MKTLIFSQLKQFAAQFLHELKVAKLITVKYPFLVGWKRIEALFINNILKKAYTQIQSAHLNFIPKASATFQPNIEKLIEEILHVYFCFDYELGNNHHCIVHEEFLFGKFIKEAD